jgi:hypothetical protein
MQLTNKIDTLMQLKTSALQVDACIQWDCVKRNWGGLNRMI